MRTRLGILLTTTVLLGSVACSRKHATQAGDYHLVVGIGLVGGLCNAPLYVALEKGYFEAEGLRYTQYKVDTNQSIPLLTTGKIDVTGNLLATLIQPLANGLEVKIDDVLSGFIRRAELARDKSEQRPDRFAVGEKVDAKITSVDRAARKLQLTIKGKEQDEDKQAIQEFGSSDSGASLGDILGAAIRRRNQQAQQE